RLVASAQLALLTGGLAGGTSSTAQPKVEGGVPGGLAGFVRPPDDGHTGGKFEVLADERPEGVRGDRLDPHGRRDLFERGSVIPAAPDRRALRALVVPPGAPADGLPRPARRRGRPARTAR